MHRTSVKGGAHTCWGKLMNLYHVYTVCTSPALNGSSALECFEHSNASEIRNRIIFDFYPGLPHVLLLCLQQRYARSIKMLYL